MIPPPITEPEALVDEKHQSAIRLTALVCVLLSRGRAPAEILRRVRAAERVGGLPENYGTSERIAARAISDWEDLKDSTVI